MLFHRTSRFSQRRRVYRLAQLDLEQHVARVAESRGAIDAERGVVVGARLDQQRADAPSIALILDGPQSPRAEPLPPKASGDEEVVDETAQPAVLHAERHGQNHE